MITHFNARIAPVAVALCAAGALLGCDDASTANQNVAQSLYAQAAPPAEGAVGEWLATHTAAVEMHLLLPDDASDAMIDHGRRNFIRTLEMRRTSQLPAEFEQAVAAYLSAWQLFDAAINDIPRWRRDLHGEIVTFLEKTVHAASVSLAGRTGLAVTVTPPSQTHAERMHLHVWNVRSAWYDVKATAQRLDTFEKTTH